MLTQAALDALAREYEGRPEAMIAWVTQTFGRRLAVAVSFGGPSGMVLIDMLARIEHTATIYYLDTGLLYPQTYEHIERVREHYGITPVAVAPAQSVDEQAREYGAALWERDPDRCCRLRKVEPQRAFLRNFDAWMTGIRRDQSSTRNTIATLDYDGIFGLVKVNPLASWSHEMVWEYIRAHDVPYNPLHDRGYPSIGCWPCTTPVCSGDDMRAGRWSTFDKTECGLHR